MNIYFGASGFAKEVAWLAEDIYEENKVDYRPDFYVTQDGDSNVNKFVNGKQILSECEFFDKHLSSQNNYFVCVGDPYIKSKIIDKIKSKDSSPVFPSLIHPDVSMNRKEGRVEIGYGVFICSKTVLTTDIIVEDFVHINISCTVGHDSKICMYSTINPNASISGNVFLGERVYVGTSAVVLQGLKICDATVIGASAVVTKSISEAGTYVGSPARKLVKN